MNDTLGIILTGDAHEGLKDLTLSRSVAALPVAGRYRIIDFVLSNMVNSGISNIGVITQNNYHSLMDHLGSGREWDLDRKKDGLFILPPYVTKRNSGWYKGSADALYNNLPYIRRSTQDYVLLCGSNSLYNTKFYDMMEYHLKKKADITVMYVCMENYTNPQLSKFGIIELNRRGRITGLEEKPREPKTVNVSMGIYLLKRELLMELIEESGSKGKYDWVKDVLIDKIDKLKVYGYCSKGYWKAINSIQNYYSANLDMLNPSLREELFGGSGPIYTKVKDEPPAKYMGNASVVNSMVADGSVIEGSVENSIIFRGVNVKKGAKIKNSIVMQNAVISEDAELESVILDKEVLVSAGKRLIGQASYPIVVPKRVVI